MDNKYEIISAHKPLNNSILPVSSVQQNGEKNVYAENVGTMNVFIAKESVAPQLLEPIKNNHARIVDRTHYNLFVVCSLDLSKNAPFILEPKRALTAYIDDDIKENFSILSDEEKEKIKQFPCIFADENAHYGRADEEQKVGYGFIKKIQVRRAGIKIFPEILCFLPQQILNEYLFELDICGGCNFNEFNRTHWSIKKVDLIAELHDLGFQIPGRER